MKLNLAKIAPLAALCLASLTARATVVFQDNFPYANGTILSNANWVAGAGNTLNNGVSVNNNNAVLSGAANSQPRAYFTNGLAGFTFPSATSNFNHTTYYFPSNAPTAALYFSYYLNVSSAIKSYHAYLTDTNFVFLCRIYACTNTVATGDFRIGVGSATTLTAATNSSGVATNIVQQDLAYNTTHLIVGRYILGSGLETVWVDPTAETNSDKTIVANATFLPPFPNVASIGLRSASGTSSPSGAMSLSNLTVATTFEEVLPASAGSNPPFLVSQPQDNTSLFVGGSATLSTLAGGDQPLIYQWYFNTNTVLTNNSFSVSGVDSNILTLTNVTVGQSGMYSCLVANTAGSTNTRFARLLVSPVPVPPGITNQPVSATNIIGDDVSFTVLAGGVPAPAYQWKYISPNNVTNNVSFTNASGMTSPTLSLSAVTTNNAGSYFVTITNLVGQTNSAVVTLTVNPVPIATLASLRGYLDPVTLLPTNTTKLFTVHGTVTTWSDMTGPANSEFYIQDATAGIVVFWSGAPASTNLPPAGAIVSVTGPLANFNGLLELSPVFGNPLHPVVVLSTNNPLPTPRPLPFDPNITGNATTMKLLESGYFVASNVWLAAGSTFVSGANDSITNNVRHVLTDNLTGLTFTNDAGQTFTMFVNAQTDIPGKAKYTGPVTIIGVLGFFSAVGPELTPSRFADIISYTHVTNIISNPVRLGDLLTNNFTESVLRPGETLTTHVAIADPEGGSVSLTPVTDGLPSTAYWTNPVSGPTASATFVFQPTPGDASSNYVAAVATTVNSVLTTNSWNIYVPTPQEEGIYITEVLAVATTNTSSRAFNPLGRQIDTNNAAVNDRFIEVANLSNTDQDLFHWTLGDSSSVWHKFFNGAPSENLASSNAIVVYGGPANNDPSAPQLSVLNFPASVSLGLSAGGGVVTVHNSSGFLVDRVAYPASVVDGSFSRFPSLNRGLVPQAFVSTNFVTAGAQYDGGAWNLSTKVPVGVPLVITYDNPVALHFTADTTKASTLWQANQLTDMFQVVTGRQFTTSSGLFTVTNPPAPMQFYFITTQ